MELDVLGSRWSRKLVMAALTTLCVVSTLPLLINAQGADSSDEQRAAFDQRVPSSVYSSPAPSSNTISTSSSLTSTNVPSSAITSSSAASSAPTQTNSSSSAAHPSDSFNPVTSNSSAPASTNKNGTASSNDRHTPYLRAGLKPQVLMGVVLATCFGLLVMILGTLFVYTRYLRPRRKSKQKQDHQPTARDVATEFSESEVDTPADTSDRGVSGNAAERSPTSEANAASV